MSAHAGPEAAAPGFLRRWGWSVEDLTVVAIWMEICALLVIWLS